jgi:hypothetical protein
MPISGLTELQKKLTQVQNALREIDGDLGTVRFDPFDPESIEHAILQIEMMIDSKLSDNYSNDIVTSIANDMKAQYREALISRAAEERLKQDDEHDDQK